MARDRRKKASRKRDTDSNNSSGENGDNSNKPKKGSSSSDSSFMAFLKKRAPIYLGLVALFLIFVIPELTKSNLEDVMPELAPEEGRVVEMLMTYSGPDQEGLSMAEVISDKITEEFGDGIYGHKDTAVAIEVMMVSTANPDNQNSTMHNVTFEIETRDGTLTYAWRVDEDTGKVTADEPDSKHIVDIVNFYD